MTFDKTTYMREYMRQRRAKGGISDKARMAMALHKIVERLDGNDKPLAAEIRSIALEAL